MNMISKIKGMLPYDYMQRRKERALFNKMTRSQEPVLYDEYGKRLRVFYLKDYLCAHTPYTLVVGRKPKEIFWDRNNFGLPIHFYSHRAIFEKQSGLHEKKHALLFESESIVPEDFEEMLSKPEIAGEYDTIFTHSARILDKYSNAKFWPANGVWYGTKENGGHLDPNKYEIKNKDISMVCSGKNQCEMHKVRQQIADIVRHNENVTGYGYYFSNFVKEKADALEQYRFSIVVENDITPYYFTEKILDCFASMTIPIYIGAEKIGDFFDENGIIQVKLEDIDKLDKLLKVCTSKYYEEHIESIKKNYDLVQNYLCMEDYLMEQYKTSI